MKFISFLLMELIFLIESGNISIIEFPVLNGERVELTKEYIFDHYGIDSYILENPRIIIIHYTAIDSLDGSLNYFKPAMIWEDREYIKRFGRVNVGVHFIVDKNGAVYSILPTTVMGRHAIGFNHVAIGIENVAADEKGLTVRQSASNASLVSYLVKKNPTIEYLAGHHEYTDKNLPHYKFFYQKNKSYIPTVKIDPGEKFMIELRRLLKDQYNVILQK